MAKGEARGGPPVLYDFMISVPSPHLGGGGGAAMLLLCYLIRVN